MEIKELQLQTRFVILLVLQISLSTFKIEAGAIGSVRNVECADKEKLVSLQEENQLLKRKLKTQEEESTRKLALETQKLRDQLTRQENVPHDQAMDIKKSEESISKLHNLKEEFEKKMTVCLNQTDSISFKQAKRNLTICQRDVYILNAISKAVTSEIRHLTYELSNCKVNATLAEMKIDQITQQLPKIKNLKIVG